MGGSEVVAAMAFAFGMVFGVIVSRIVMRSKLKLYEQFISDRLGRELLVSGLFSPPAVQRPEYAEPSAGEASAKLAGAA